MKPLFFEDSAKKMRPEDRRSTQVAQLFGRTAVYTASGSRVTSKLVTKNKPFLRVPVIFLYVTISVVQACDYLSWKPPDTQNLTCHLEFDREVPGTWDEVVVCAPSENNF